MGKQPRLEQIAIDKQLLTYIELASRRAKELDLVHHEEIEAMTLTTPSSHALTDARLAEIQRDPFGVASGKQIIRELLGHIDAQRLRIAALEGALKQIKGGHFLGASDAALSGDLATALQSIARAALAPPKKEKL